MDLGRLREPHYSKLWERARTHLERRDGDLSGTFSVPVTLEERGVLNGLLGTERSPTKAGLQVEAGRLDDTLRGGYGLGLAEFLEHIGPRLRYKSDEERRTRLLREQILAPARASHLTSQDWYSHWLEWVETKGAVTSLAKKEDTHTLSQVVRALEVIVGDRDPVLLQDLAVRITGDTKALNEGAGPLPKLVLGALAERSRTTRPESSQESRALWEEHEVVPDDLASRALVLGLPAQGEGLGQWLTDAAARGVPFQVTLHQLVSMPVVIDAPVVYVCENPAVLRAAAQQLGAHSAPLVCSEGWPSAAFHRLVNAVTEGGGRLHHHGDFDRAGLSITRRMVERHGALPWRMGASDYLAHEPYESFPLGVAPGSSPWDPDLEHAMVRRGHVVFEETVVDVLLEDLRARD